MVIAALATFVILFVAWLVAPSPARADRRDHAVVLPTELVPEVT